MNSKVGTQEYLLQNESSVFDYISLMKPRVMSLVIFTAFVGIYLAPTSNHYLINCIALICIALGSGSAAVINMWYDRDIDAVMQRTKNRPIVLGIIDPDESLSFGLVLGFFAVFLMALCVDYLAALLLLITISYYIFIYTMWLKRSSIHNVVIGGVSGALPPVIGWVSASGVITLEAIILFMIIFLWTPAHSWALALYRLDDYQKAVVPMMPAVKGAIFTKWQIFIYSILTVIISVVPYFIGLAGTMYLTIAILHGFFLIYYSLILFKDNKKNIYAKKFFFYSIFYLFIIFLGLLLF